jgi:hypothetical protein
MSAEEDEGSQGTEQDPIVMSSQVRKKDEGDAALIQRLMARIQELEAKIYGKEFETEQEGMSW